MVVPHSYLVALLMTILTMACWGSWANVVKLVKEWRFELLYYDYSLGILLTFAFAGLTLGSIGSYGRTFLADLAATNGRNIAFGFLGGVVYCLSNILVVGAMAVAGLGVAFPIGVGLALVVGVIWNYCVNPQGNPVLLFLGVALVVAAIVLDGIAYRIHTMAKAVASHEPGATNPGEKDKIRKGILLSVAGGLMMGMFFPLVEIGKTGPQGMGPYAIGFVFAAGIFLSTFVFNAYFLRKPSRARLCVSVTTSKEPLKSISGESSAALYGPWARSRASLPPVPHGRYRSARPSATRSARAQPWSAPSGALSSGKSLPAAESW